MPNFSQLLIKNFYKITKKNLLGYPLGCKNFYWISSALLWNSTILITLIHYVFSSWRCLSLPLWRNFNFQQILGLEISMNAAILWLPKRLFLKVNKSLFSRGNILIRKLKVRAGKLKSDLSSHLLALRFTNSVSQVSNGPLFCL